MGLGSRQNALEALRIYLCYYNILPYTLPMSFFKRIQSNTDNDSHEERDNDDPIDPQLRLRTVRTASSVIAESIRSELRAERRKSLRKSLQEKEKRSFFRRNVAKERGPQADSSSTIGQTKEILGARRNVHVNHPLSAIEVDHNEQPKARYLRNKVRTTKYTIITFIPKNLYEQFHRVANLFFLVLVILQLFPIFGAATGSIAVFPLAFILGVTAIKDGIEDYRRGVLDEVVNTSAVTRLGGAWKNVNQPLDPRPWYQRLLGLNRPGRVTRGVRKLRDREAGRAENDVRTMLHRDSNNTNITDSTASLDFMPKGPGGRTLYDIQSIDSHTYPPPSLDVSKISLSESGSPQIVSQQPQSPPSQYQPSVNSRSSLGVVDWRKHTSGLARWERTLWKKLEVGDIVLLRDNEQIPADVVVLATSDPDGMCYLETKNLDGETNLKPRKAIKATTGITTEEDIEKSSFYLDSEPPHANLYLYHGVLRYSDATNNDLKQEAVTINEMLLRGCALRNTPWVIALVVFTGADTKIMRNGGDTPSKRSKIEKETNFNVLVNFCLLTIMCLVAACFSGLEDAQRGTSAYFFEAGSDPTSSPVLNAIVTFVSCFIAFQNIIPISLYISIEIVKTIQAYFIAQDIDMYYTPSDAPCVPKTWNISDDLGQIEYIFSDKTGTLTQNVMEFQKCSVHGTAYGEGITEAQRGAATREGKAQELDPKEIDKKLKRLKSQMIESMERAFKNKYLQQDKLTLVSPQLAQDMIDRQGEQRQHIIAFFRSLAICHSVLSDRPDAQNEPWKVVYKAESPDEAALVAAARDSGFPFIGRTKDGIDIEVMGQPERYIPLRVLEFNSTRKRMSVVVRRPDGKLVLYCKGADSVIYARLRPDHDPWLKEQTAKDMEMFANNGLRTLCIAYREMEEEEFLSWSKGYDAATNALENRDEEMENACNLVEKDLLILGATALEDKLQEGVPDAIETLHKAGIKLWILTGDKLQTAIEIGYSCNLLKSSMEVMILSADSLEDTRSQIEAGLNKIASVLGPPLVRTGKPKDSERGFVIGAQASFAVVIDGDTLTHALAAELKPLFLSLGTQCETVVCCRVSPAQKALTVKLVKEGKNAMTLSIGDGANDVAMIQEANIGCGLLGLEGSQAAMSADYAFGQFRFLTKLLLVHGRWSYQRVAEMHSNFFYKNVIWTFAMFWYLPFNSFSASYLYQYTFILLCNLVFTSLPVIILGAFDQDINAKAALAFPQLYVRGIRGLEYTRAKFWLYMTDGLYQSAVIFFIPFCAWRLGSQVTWNGKGIESLSDFGTTVAVSGIVAANTYVGLGTNYWTVMTWIATVGSSLIMLIWVVIYSFFPSVDFRDEVVILFGSLQFWTTVFLTVFVALGPKFIVKYYRTVYFPLDKEIIREMWVEGNLKDQLGIRHRKARKNRSRSPGNLEAAPMFHEMHTRSISETSSHTQPYERAPSSSPPLGAATRLTYLDTPPMKQKELSIPPGLTPSLSANISSNRPEYKETFSSLNPSLPSVNLQVPTPTTQSYRPSASPQPSLYSVSDLPPPSPPSETVYRYPSGEFTTTPPPSSRRSSTHTATPRAPESPPPELPNPFPSLPRQQQQSSSSVHIDSHPTSSTDGGHGTYEMGAREPEVATRIAPIVGMSGSDRSDSEVSYRADGFQTTEDGSHLQSGSSHNAAGSGWRMSDAHIPSSSSDHGELSTPTPRQSYLYDSDGDDSATIVGKPRDSSIGWAM